MSAKDLEIAPSSVKTEPALLHDEIVETSRRLIQHLIFACLLTLRLSMIPLLYVYQYFSRKDDNSSAIIRSILSFSQNVTVGNARLQSCHSTPIIQRVYGMVETGVRKCYRIVKAFNTIVQFVDQNSESFQAQTLDHESQPTLAVISLRAIGTLVATQGNDQSNAEQRDALIPEMVESPTSASQTYHAALHGATLDQVLAVFETSSSSRTNHHCLRNIKSESEISDYQRYRHHNLGQQNTSGNMETRNIFDEGARSRFSDKSPKAGMTFDSNADPRLPTCMNHLSKEQENTKGLQNPSNTHGSYREDECFALLNKMSSASLRRCPTFVRRHTQTKLPRRRINDDMLPINTSKHRIDVKDAENNRASPIKRAKLQRRVRVYHNKP